MRGRGGEKHLDRVEETLHEWEREGGEGHLNWVEETLREGERGKRGGAFRPSGGDLK